MPMRALGITAPTTYSDLERTLRDHLGDFSKSNRRIAEFILAEPASFAFKTIGQAAAEAEVNQSTVNRFATAIGLSGYPALTALCKQRLRDRALMVERFAKVSSSDSRDGGAMHEAASLDGENITRTFDRIDAGSWKATVNALASARVVHVIGLRNSFSMSSLLAYLLNLVRDDVRHVDLIRGMLADQLRGVAKGDAFVAIATHPYVGATVRSMQYASSRGAATVALTDTATSPLARHADWTYLVETGGGHILESVTATTALVQALATDVAVHLGAKSKVALRTQDDLLDAFRTYGDG